TGGRLGRLRYARQELVRLSESNTKYGGKRGKTGVSTAPVIGPSISESKRIRQAKKSCAPLWIWLRPAVHRESNFLRSAIASAGLPLAGGRVWLACRAAGGDGAREAPNSVL